MANPFELVHEFERQVAKYTGSPFATATDSCSHAIFLSSIYCKKNHNEVTIPKNTYISIPMQLIHAGYKLNFVDKDWKGYYYIEPTPIIDAAPRFTENMYIPGTYTCVSFQFHKILSTNRGGMILTDDEDFYKWSQSAVHDGRNMGVPYNVDNISILGYHMFMPPETAETGLAKLQILPKYNEDVAGSYTYHDISYIGNFTR